MKRFSKALLLTLLAVAMVLNTCGIALATTDTATVAIREEGDSVKKLVFKATTPDNIKTTSFVFSYDNTVIQPVNADGETVDVEDAFVAGAGLTLTPVGVYVDEENCRTGVRVDSYSVDGVNTTAGMNVLEFYFKVADGAQANVETFKIEETYEDGSILKAFYPKNEAIASPVKVGAYNTKADNVTYTLSYTGDDVAALGLLAVTADKNAVDVPVLYPTAGDEVTVALTATGKDTEDADYTALGATQWSLEEAIDGVTIEGDGAEVTLKVAPGAEAGTAKVVAQNGKVKSEAVEIAIKRNELIYPAKILIDGVQNPAYSKPEEGTEDITIKAALYDQYGDLCNAFDTFTFEAADVLPEGVTLDGDKLRVASTTPGGAVAKVTVTPSINISLEETFEIKINGVDIYWDENVTVKPQITYGETNGSAVTIADNETNASINGDGVKGTFTVVDADVAQPVGSRTITVEFTHEGSNKKTKTFDVEIVKADFDMSAISVENQSVEYTGVEAYVESWLTNEDLPEGVVIDKITYDGSDVVPTNAGKYTVTITFKVTDEANNNVPASVTATLTINKAAAEISAAAEQTFAYDGTAQKIDAGVVKGEDGAQLQYSEGPEFTDAGTYTVKITLPESENYKEDTAEVKVIITKADAASYEYADTEFTMTAKDAAEASIDSIEDLQTYLELPEKVDVKISTTAEPIAVDVTWEAQETEWDAKGGAYTFKAIPSDADKNNINFNVVEAEDDTKTELELIVTAEVVPVTAKIVEVDGVAVAEGEMPYKTNITVKAADLAAATSYKDLGIPEKITVKYDWEVEEETITDTTEGDDQTNTADSTEGGDGSDTATEEPVDTTVKYEEVELTWSKTLEELKALAVGSEVTIEMTKDLSLAYATIAGADDINFGVIADDKILVEFEIEISDRAYGDERTAAKIKAVAENEDTILSKDLKVVYTGKTASGVEYSSEEVPGLAGEYTVKVTHSDSEKYGGSSYAEFKVAPKQVPFTVADATKGYLDANPTFTLTNSQEAVTYLVEEDYAGMTNTEGLDDNVFLGKVVETVLGITYNCPDTASYSVGEYESIISATKSNPNYELILTEGTLTVVKKSLEREDVAAPVINGKLTDGKLTIGETLTVNPVEGINTDEYTWQWTADGAEIEGATNASYIPVIADSNKVIAVKMVAENDGNYADEKASEGYTVAKYAISGKVGVTITDNGVENKLDEGDIVTADVTTIKDYTALSTAGITFGYQWYLNGNEIDGETSSSITIPRERGILTVTVTATGNFEGSITATAGEIGKTALAGAIVLAEAEGVITADLTGIAAGVAGTDYDIVWLRGKTDITDDVKDNAYTITDADYGQTITVKAVAKGEDFAGEIVATYSVAAKSPSNVTISTSTTSTSIALTLTAKANGAAIKYFDVVIKAADIIAGTAKVYADSNGDYKYTFGDLTTGTTYTINAKAVNEVGDSEESTTTATPASSGGSGGGGGGGGGSASSVKVEDTTSTDNKEATVTVAGSEAKVNAATIEGKETLTTNLTTSEGTEVGVTVDVADTAINSITISAEKSDTEVTGKAADGAIGAPIEVKVEAVDAKGNEVGTAAATVKLSSDKEAHGYVVDALGNTVRADSTYDAETGTVTISGVANGAVVVLSTTAPAEFADIDEGRWSEAEINKASDLGLVNGTGAGRFAPAENLTRYQAMQISFNKVVHVLGMDLEKNAETKIDTDKAHWAFEAASYSASTGIFNGTSALEDGTFVMSGEDTITRGQYFTAMARLMQRVLPDDHTADGVSTVFEDAAEIADYAAEPIDYLVKLGIVGGTKTATGYVVKANDNITREEAAAISVRIYNYLAKVIAK